MWIVNLDNATFDFSEDAWKELELTGAELRKFNAQHPRNPDGTFKEKGSGSSGSSDSGSSDGDNKNGSSSDGGSKSGKSSGPARFKDSNGDGKDDRQLSASEMRKALSGLPKAMRDALAIYPSVLGAIKMALENNEDPTKHLERLPSNLRGAAEKAAKSVASGSGGKSYKGMSARKISDLPDEERMAIPQSELPDPPSGYTWAEDRSLVKNSFYDNAEAAWSVDLDGAFFDFSEVAWKKGIDMSASEAAPNYILEAREYVMEAMPDGPEGWDKGEDSRLIDLYALLALTEGESVTAEQVHDAWAAWRNHTKSDHKSIVPFEQLTDDVKKMDEPYVKAIKQAARKLKQSANEMAE